MKEQIKINADKINPFLNFQMTFYTSVNENKLHFLKMILNYTSVDVKFIRKILT